MVLAIVTPRKRSVEADPGEVFSIPVEVDVNLEYLSPDLKRRFVRAAIIFRTNYGDQSWDVPFKGKKTVYVKFKAPSRSGTHTLSCSWILRIVCTRNLGYEYHDVDSGYFSITVYVRGYVPPPPPSFDIRVESINYPSVVSPGSSFSISVRIRCTRGSGTVKVKISGVGEKSKRMSSGDTWTATFTLRAPNKETTLNYTVYVYKNNRLHTSRRISIKVRKAFTYSVNVTCPPSEIEEREVDVVVTVKVSKRVTVSISYDLLKDGKLVESKSPYKREVIEGEKSYTIHLKDLQPGNYKLKIRVFFVEYQKYEDRECTFTVKFEEEIEWEKYKSLFILGFAALICLSAIKAIFRRD